MQLRVATLFNSMVSVATQRPAQRQHVWRWLGCAITALVGSARLLAIFALVAGPEPQSGLSLVWMGLSALQALMLIVVAAWIGWDERWQPTNSYERRRGNILIIVSLFLMLLVASELAISFDLFQIRTLLIYVILFLTGGQIIWLARRGRVRLAGGLLVATVLLSVLANQPSTSGAANGLGLLLNVIAVLIGGLLVSWWCALALALGLPLAHALLWQLDPRSVAPEPARAGAELAALLTIGAIVALYTRSLETALRDAEARDAELTAASAALRGQNVALQRQTAALHDTQDRLRQTVADQERRIAEAVAELRARSVELSTIQTPLIRIARGVLVVPLVGAWDERRSEAFSRELLRGVEQQRAHTAVLDLTGLAAMSEGVARMVLRIVTSTRMLGCRCVLVGIQPESAQALVSLGIDLSQVETGADLAHGVALSLRGQV